MSRTVRAPFPYIGGKSRAAALVWERFGDPMNYVEPFFGSGAVLLARPVAPGDARTETVNDLDPYLSNFWRALKWDRERLAELCDWPVSEVDLFARHTWLVNEMPAHRERIWGEETYYDTKMAAYWLWGICQWIGPDWCNADYQDKGCRRIHLGRGEGILRKNPAGISRKRPNLGGHGGGNGIHRAGIMRVPEQIPSVINPGKGINARGVMRKRPIISGPGGGVVGIHAQEKRAGTGARPYERREAILALFNHLEARLRGVRMVCGDFLRVLTPSVTTFHGVTGVFLDPPYDPEKADRAPALYSTDDHTASRRAREWALEHGEEPKLRMALCGYEGEHEMPASWECVAWLAGGGYANYGNREGKENRKRERIWFSPHCLRPQVGLFDGVGA